MRYRLALLLPLLAFALATTAPLAAQAPKEVYPAKFLCGYHVGQVPNLSDPPPFPIPYSTTEPGSYSTIVNVVNLALGSISADVNLQIVVEGFPRQFLPNLTLAPLSTAKITCQDITNALVQGGFNANGHFVEGYLILITNPATIGVAIDVTAVYTYESQNGSTNKSFGLGLGSSIHLQRIDPRLLTQPE
jgi:hypothetical protein